MNTVIVDDHELMRELLRKCCSTVAGLNVVGEAGSGQDAVRVVLQERPELLLLDLSLPDFSGFRVLRTLREADFLPRCVLLVSGHCNDLVVFLAEQANVQGFLCKTAATMDGVCQAIRDVAEGRLYWSPSFIEIRDERRGNPDAFDKVLSEREVLILTLCGSLLTDEEIGKRLGITTDTATKHRANIYRKLNITTRLDLIRFAHDPGFYDARMVL